MNPARMIQHISAGIMPAISSGKYSRISERYIVNKAYQAFTKAE